MGYFIYASLDNGNPCLRVVDADSHKLCLNWHCQAGPDSDETSVQRELQRLFRDLLLVSCQQKCQGKDSRLARG